MHVRRRFLPFLLPGLLLGILGCGGRSGEKLTADGLVALGDSFSAGVGAGSLTGSCGRSTEGWTGQLAEDLGMTLNNLACAGANLDDIGEQAEQIPPTARIVALNATGNDIEFMSIVADCLAADCVEARDQRRELFDGLETKTERTLRRVIDAAPELEVLIVSLYPTLVGQQTGCDTFPTRRAEVVDGAVAFLNTTLRRVVERLATEGLPVTLAEPESIEEHTLCSEEPWFHGPDAGPLLLHPDRNGHRAMADGALRAVIAFRADAA